MLVASNYKDNKNPKIHLEEAVNDVQEMKKIFEKAEINYDVVPLLNKEANKDWILALVRQLSQYLKTYVSKPKNVVKIKEKTLVFAFAGHGDSNDMLHTDEEKVTDILSLGDIMKYFVDHPDLQDIPKLFFIDACRGKRVISRDKPGPAPCYEVGNFLIARSTILDFCAYDTNSWMRKLAEKISEDSSKHLALMLDEVTAEVRLNTAEENARQPEYVSRLWCSFKFC